MRILVINRGEIACRIIQAAQELGHTACAVYSEVDADWRPVKLADEAYCIGEALPSESYLNIEKLVALAKENKIDAVHPGYGFLSERAHAAEAFTKAGIKFIGPRAESIQLLGNKMQAKEILDQEKLPTLPWAKLENTEADTLKKAAKNVGYPLLLKAAAGGGGKGMRLVQSEDELVKAAAAAQNEARTAFGDDTILLERYLENPRHIEVQILGDSHGNVTHFGERDCSYQRRHQKVVEEAPAPKLSDRARKALCDTAVKLARKVGYESAGTVEFLLDKNEDFFFLEMNSRLQVEHSVTEAVWGIDLVHLQIKVTEGHSLDEIVPARHEARGHAIEARVYAEDPANQYAPCPGKLHTLEWPSGTGIRIDTGVSQGNEIGLDYDPMIAKITASAPDRQTTINRLLWALKRTVVFGSKCNINFLQDIIDHQDFRDFNIHVKYLDGMTWKDEIPEDIVSGKDELARSAERVANESGGPLNRFASPWEAN